MGGTAAPAGGVAAAARVVGPLAPGLGPAPAARGRAPASPAGVAGVVATFGACAVGAAAAVSIYFSTKKQRDAQARVDRYDASLRAYLEALRAGALDAEIVTQLMSDLDAIRTLADKSVITVDFSTEPSATLVHLVVEYTRQLAECNDVELSALDNLRPTEGTDTVIYLRRHLEAQRRIFTEAA